MQIPKASGCSVELVRDLSGCDSGLVLGNGEYV